MMTALRTAVVAFNRCPVWRQKVRIGPDVFRATSFDRLIYLGKRKLFNANDAESRFLAGKVQSGMHVVDVGANVGNYTLLFGRAVGPTGKVTAFEPDPDV